MQSIDRPSQISDGSRVQQHVVGRSQAGGSRGLGCQDGTRLFQRAAVTVHYALQLDRLVHVDHENAIHAIERGALDQQRDGQYDISAFGGRRPLFHTSSNQRMKDGLQVSSCSWIPEYQVSESTAVKFAVLPEYTAAEPPDDFRKAGFSRSDHGAGRLVRVDDRDA